MGGLAKLSTRMVALLLKVCALSITLNTYTQKHRGGMGGLAKLSARMLCCTNFFPDVCSEHLHLQSSESGWVDLQNFQVVCALNTYMEKAASRDGWTCKSFRSHGRSAAQMFFKTCALNTYMEKAVSRDGWTCKSFEVCVLDSR